MVSRPCEICSTGEHCTDKDMGTEPGCPFKSDPRDDVISSGGIDLTYPPSEGGAPRLPTHTWSNRNECASPGRILVTTGHGIACSVHWGSWCTCRAQTTRTDESNTGGIVSGSIFLKSNRWWTDETLPKISQSAQPAS